MEGLSKFQNLVRKLFQFDSSDLDFGIYRILNYKREKIENFIEVELKKKVEEAFAKHKDERLINVQENFEKVKAEIHETLGKSAFTPSGDLKEEFKDTPIGKKIFVNKRKERGSRKN